MANINATRLKMTDSLRNWPINLCLKAPNVFLTPTSWARVAERAVDKFIKLIHARNKIKIAIPEKR